MAGKSLVDVYPNPFTERTTIRFAGHPEDPLLIQIFNAAGQRIATLAHGRYDEGLHSSDWEAGSLPAGTYYVRYQTRYQQQGKWIVKAK